MIEIFDESSRKNPDEAIYNHIKLLDQKIHQQSTERQKAFEAELLQLKEDLGIDFQELMELIVGGRLDALEAKIEQTNTTIEGEYFEAKAIAKVGSVQQIAQSYPHLRELILPMLVQQGREKAAQRVQTLITTPSSPYRKRVMNAFSWMSGKPIDQL